MITPRGSSRPVRSELFDEHPLESMGTPGETLRRDPESAFGTCFNRSAPRVLPRWNRTLGGWVFQKGRQSEVVDALRADPSNVVTLDSKLSPSSGPSQASPPETASDGARDGARDSAGPSLSPEDAVARACAAIPPALTAEPKASTPEDARSERKTKASRDLPVPPGQARWGGATGG